jgi:hypothetical protein
MDYQSDGSLKLKVVTSPRLIESGGVGGANQTNGWWSTNDKQ